MLNQLNARKRKRTILSLILLIVILLLCSCANNGGTISVGGYTYEASQSYLSGGAQVSGRVAALDVSWLEGQVTIAFHDGEDVLLTETARRAIDAHSELRWRLDGGTLYVKYAESGYNARESLGKELTLLLPRSIRLDDVKLSLISASVQTDALTADRITVQSVSGSVHVSVEAAKQLSLSSISGALSVEALRLDEAEVSTTSGDVTLEIACTPDGINVDSVSGNVTLRLPQEAGFTAEMSSVSGRVRGSMPMQSLGGKRYAGGDGHCSIRIDTVSGHVYLDALEK